MAIAPRCDKCGKELIELGAILLSPPDVHSRVIKFHLCKSCYQDLRNELTAPDPDISKDSQESR